MTRGWVLDASPSQTSNYTFLPLLCFMFSGENVGVFGGTNIAISAGGTANINESSGTFSRAFEILMTKVSSRALHNSGEISDPPKCHPGTRIKVLDLLIAWAMASTYLFPIKWLAGPAGAGKSAIMRTFAEMLVQHGLLLASFFIFRSDSNRNNASQLIATLVYQICRAIPHIRPYVEEAINLDPLIFTSTLHDQIQKLVVDPFLRFFYYPNSVAINPFPRIILIDGLDECQGEDAQLEILGVFCETLRTLPIPIAIVIASRPEYQIRSAFDLGHVNQLSSRIVLDDSFTPDKDIETFYRAEFSEIRRAHPMRSHLPAIWPGPQVIVVLVQNASGQFIYASTVIKFVRSIRHNPSTRLDIILGLVDRGTSKPFQQLDLLYATIFFNVQDGDLPAVLRVLGIILTPPPRWSEHSFQSPYFLEKLLGYQEGEVRRLFIDLESLLTVPSNWHFNVRILHTSLGDFLFDKSRAEGLSIDKAGVCADIAGLCIGQMFSGFYEPMMEYIIHQFSVSLKNAAPTDRLRQLIVACNMEELGNLVPQFDNRRRHPNYGLKILTPIFLDALQSSTFSDAPALHTNKMASFRKSLTPRMGIYLDNALPFGLLMIPLTTFWQPWVPQFLEALGLVPPPELILWDRDAGLDLCRFDPDSIYMDSFVQLILDFLSSRDTLIDSRKVQTRCTNLTIRLLQYINLHITQRHGGFRAPQDQQAGIGRCLMKLLPFLFKLALVRDDLINVTGVVLSSGSEYMKISEIEEALASYMRLAVWRNPETHRIPSPPPQLPFLLHGTARRQGPQRALGSHLQTYPQNRQHGLALQQPYLNRLPGDPEHLDLNQYSVVHPERGLQEGAISQEIGITDMIPRSVLYRELSRGDRDTAGNLSQQNDPFITQRPPVESPRTVGSSQRIDRLLTKCQRRE